MIFYRYLFAKFFLHWPKSVQVESGSGQNWPPGSAFVNQDSGSTTLVYRQDIERRLIQVWLRERKHCNLCDVVIDSIRLAKIHFNSRLHREAAGRPVIKEFFLYRLCFSAFRFFHVSAVLHIAGVSHLENLK
jgi:hypothetical protein